MKHTAPFVRSAYNYDMNAAGDDAGLECLDKSLAQQHMAADCDINVLVARFKVTGELPTVQLPPMQGDFTNAPTYQEALNLMIEANKSFMQLPAKTRSRFDNDPGQFIAFVSDEANRDEMRRMGLWSPEAVEAFELKAQNQAELNALNARDAELYRKTGVSSHGVEKTTPKGGTQKGTT